MNEPIPTFASSPVGNSHNDATHDWIMTNEDARFLKRAKLGTKPGMTEQLSRSLECHRTDVCEGAVRCVARLRCAVQALGNYTYVSGDNYQAMN
jgi:hypothetical protein